MAHSAPRHVVALLLLSLALAAGATDAAGQGNDRADALRRETAAALDTPSARKDFGGATVLHEAHAIRSLDDTSRSFSSVDGVLWGPLDPQRAMKWTLDEFTLRMLEYRGYIRFHRFSDMALREATTTRRGLWRSGVISIDRVEQAMGGSLDRFVTYGDSIRPSPPPTPPGRSMLDSPLDRLAALVRSWLSVPAFAGPLAQPA